jgi:hypothetical protein
MSESGWIICGFNDSELGLNIDLGKVSINHLNALRRLLDRRCKESVGALAAELDELGQGSAVVIYLEDFVCCLHYLPLFLGTGSPRSYHLCCKDDRVA